MTSLRRESVHSLADLLVGERRCCAALTELLERERAAAVQNDLDGLLGSLREREDLQARWQRVSTARNRALASGPSLALLMQNDPELAATVTALRREAAALRSAQRINDKLIAAALAGVNDLLGTIRRMLPGARYDARASMTANFPRRQGLHRSA
jgi:hypothetical protein